MFGVITAIRPAGDVNPWNAQFFLHKQGEAAHLLTPVQPTAPQTLADYVGAFQSSMNDLRPRRGGRLHAERPVARDLLSRHGRHGA